jgi:hypothetical protein
MLLTMSGKSEFASPPLWHDWRIMMVSLAPSSEALTDTLIAIYRDDPAWAVKTGAIRCLANTSFEDVHKNKMIDFYESVIRSDPPESIVEVAAIGLMRLAHPDSIPALMGWSLPSQYHTALPQRSPVPCPKDQSRRSF